MEKTRQAAEQWVAEGRPCAYGYGLWNGHGFISHEEAVELISQPDWSFGMGFHELKWIVYNGQDVLLFKQLHENDLW